MTILSKEEIEIYKEKGEEDYMYKEAYEYIQELRKAIMFLKNKEEGYCWCADDYNWRKFGHSIACSKAAEVLSVEQPERLKKEKQIHGGEGFMDWIKFGDYK